MEQPIGFKDPKRPDLVCRLYKSLYGLKQAPRAWFDKLHRALISLGFTLARSDQSLFIRITYEESMFVLVHVDDILLTCSNSDAVKLLIQQLNERFALKDLGEIDYFLGIQGKHTQAGLLLSQTKYVTDLLSKAKMQYSKLVSAPMTHGLRLTSYGSDPAKALNFMGALLVHFNMLPLHGLK